MTKFLGYSKILMLFQFYLHFMHFAYVCVIIIVFIFERHIEFERISNAHISKVSIFNEILIIMIYTAIQFHYRCFHLQHFEPLLNYYHYYPACLVLHYLPYFHSHYPLPPPRSSLLLKNYSQFLHFSFH